MVITQTKKEYIESLHGKTFTIYEAFEIENFISENFMTDNLQIRWVNNKTKNSVIIGNNSVSKKTYRKQLSKKEKQKIIDMKTEKHSKNVIKSLMDGPILNVTKTVNRQPYFLKIKKLPKYEKL
jgi:hypothetical protein